MELLCQYDGEAFRPLARHAKQCDATYVCGEKYYVEPIAPRDMRAHRAYFAQIKDAWLNLREDQAERFATPEALRKYALIQCGFRDERTIVADSKAAAQRLSAFIKPMDEHAVVTVRDCVVRVYTAQSQSVKAMGPDDFKRSKRDVLDFVASLIGVTTQALEREGAAA